MSKRTETVEDRLSSEFHVSKHARLVLWTLGIVIISAYGSQLVSGNAWPVWVWLLFPGLYGLITQSWFRKEFLRREQVAHAYKALWRTDQLADALGYFYNEVHNRYQKRPEQSAKEEQLYRRDEGTGEYISVS